MLSGWIPTLLIVADTIVASLDTKETAELIQSHPNKALDLRQFAGLKATDLDGLDREMLPLLEALIPLDKRSSFDLVFKALNSSVGTALLFGPVNGNVSFVKLDRKDRESCLSTLSNSRFYQLRLVFKSFRALSLLLTYGRRPSKNGQLIDNPVWKTLQYPGPVPEGPRALEKDVWRPDFLKLNSDSILEYDIVVVGSGPGGGLMAAELSKAGHKVLLVEKAKYIHPSDLSLIELDAFKALYEKSGGLVTECGGLQMFAGAAWGGGSFVNWSASLQLPTNVRQEWADEYGLDYFVSPEYQRAIETVSKRIGVSTAGVIHNPSNQILMDGCKTLGYPCETIAQNTAGHAHECGFCSLGCPYSIKQSTTISWIRDAAEAGCHFLDNVYVDKVMHTSGIVRGIVAHRGSLNITIKSKQVVVSCGSINSPALLIRSGLKNKHIGRHLRLHPVAVAFGIYPDRETKPWRGSIMTALSKVVENIDGKGYGSKIEVPTIHPAILSLLIPWKSAKQHKILYSKFNHTAALISLTRDRFSEGTVWVDGQGIPRIDWFYSPHDQKATLAGLIAAIKILLAAGATEVYTTQFGLEPFKRDPNESLDTTLTSPLFLKYIQAVTNAGVDTPSTGLLCAHQMGSCRMASSSSKGAVKPSGESFEVKGLYVSDASVFPTASGVNPMLTTYSVAYSIAQFMKRDLAQPTPRL